MDNEERLLIARSHKQNLKEKHMEFCKEGWFKDGICDTLCHQPV